MRGLRRGIVSIALAGALATGGFIGGMMLSGGAATAATGGATTGLTGTAVAATASPSATPKSNESAAHEKQAENSGTARHNCPHPSSSASATSTSSNV